MQFVKQKRQRLPLRGAAFLLIRWRRRQACIGTGAQSPLAAVGWLRPRRRSKGAARLVSRRGAGRKDSWSRSSRSSFSTGKGERNMSTRCRIRPAKGTGQAPRHPHTGRIGTTSRERVPPWAAARQRPGDRAPGARGNDALCRTTATSVPLAAGAHGATLGGARPTRGPMPGARCVPSSTDAPPTIRGYWMMTESLTSLRWRWPATGSVRSGLRVRSASLPEWRSSCVAARWPSSSATCGCRSM